MISWRKGLFRLWVLLSITWIVLAIAFAFYFAAPLEKWRQFQRAADWERVIERIESGIAAGGMNDNQGVFQTVDELTRDREKVKQYQPEIIRASDDAKWWLLNAMVALLAPVFVVFVLGRAAIWVAIGFRGGSSD